MAGLVWLVHLHSVVTRNLTPSRQTCYTGVGEPHFRGASKYIGTPRYESSYHHPAMTQPIPAPPSVPFLGNVTQIEDEVPLRSFELLSKQYGEIYQLNLIGGCHFHSPRVFVLSYIVIRRQQDGGHKQLRAAERGVRRETIPQESHGWSARSPQCCW